jgi:hypothetical protein
VTCPGCGAPRPDRFARCAFCGRDVDAHPFLAAAAMVAIDGPAEFDVTAMGDRRRRWLRQDGTIREE